jgi:hypothetical protein
MGTIETALSPTEILRRMYERLRAAYDKLATAKAGDAEADEKILEEIDAIEALVMKLHFSFIRKLRDDAGLDKGKFEELAKFEEMLDDIYKGWLDGLRGDKYISNLARNIRNIVRREKKKSKRAGRKELVEVKKGRKELKEKEKKAKEKVGAK